MDEISAIVSQQPAQPRTGGAGPVSRSEAVKRPDTDRRTAVVAEEAQKAVQKPDQKPAPELARESARESDDGDPVAKAESVINELVEFADHPNSRLEIELHEKTGQFVYKAVNIESGEVLRQYPAEEVLRQIEFFREIQGLAVNRTA